MKKTTMFRVGISLIPILILVTLLALNISIFGSDAILGASQVALLFSAGVAIWLAMWLFKVPWQDFEEAIKSNIGDVTTAIVILFLIGAISGTWTMSGIVPTFIYYGVKIISPKIFLLTACVICALVSVMVGSSWTTIATIGVALLGIGKVEGFSDGVIAGAIISGAYFGDKISPLSDTTVLASSMSKVPMFTHIRYLMYTTVPSIVITLIIFLILGLSHNGDDAAMINEYTNVLGAKFNITPWLMIVPAFTAIMIARKMPALIVLALSTVLAAAAALIFQPDIMREIGSSVSGSGSSAKILFTGTIETIYNSVSVETGNPDVDQLVASKGMLGMLNTVYLIICAMCFGAAMKASGMLHHLASMILPMTKTPGKSRDLDSGDWNSTQRHSVRSVSGHHPDIKPVQGHLRERGLREQAPEPRRGGFRHGHLATLPVEQLRNDTGDYPERADDGLPAILLLQPAQSADERHSGSHRLQDIQNSF